MMKIFQMEFSQQTENGLSWICVILSSPLYYSFNWTVDTQIFGKESRLIDMMILLMLALLIVNILKSVQSSTHTLSI